MMVYALMTVDDGSLAEAVVTLYSDEDYAKEIASDLSKDGVEYWVVGWEVF